ncbi:MAG: general stress protein [Candidatus Eremiobacteraeota bacterium]|nr:general stress protein [Candidatus Eremiobacteraeota bacterium]
METSENRYEAGTFYNRHDADTAVKLLHDLGYKNDEISVVMKDREKAQEFAEATGSKAAEGATTGGIIGGALGAIVAGFTATGALFTIVGTGGLAAPVILGPLAAVLAGMGAGGLAGGVIGGLIGAGIPEERALELEAGVAKGGSVIAVRPHEENAGRVGEILGSGERGSMARTEMGEIEPDELTPEPTTADIPPRRVIP